MNISYDKLSSFISESLIFSKNVYDIYKMIDFIKVDYEHVFEWYWGTAVPCLLNGTMDFFIATDESINKIVGIAIVRKMEQKICTLFVEPNYSGKGIATNLLNMTFEYTGTTKPMITFPDYK